MRRTSMYQVDVLLWQSKGIGQAHCTGKWWSIFPKCGLTRIRGDHWMQIEQNSKVQRAQGLLRKKNYWYRKGSFMRQKAYLIAPLFWWSKTRRWKRTSCLSKDEMICSSKQLMWIWKSNFCNSLEHVERLRLLDWLIQKVALHTACISTTYCINYLNLIYKYRSSCVHIM
jgi:hypothetical protein